MSQIRASHNSVALRFFYRSATSGWSLEVSVYAELTVTVVDIISQQNMNLFMKIIVG